jgi:DNA-binding response OmpR family regulator
MPTSEDHSASSEALDGAPRAVTRLLIVDDNEDSAELLGIFLEAEGYQVRTAHDGTSALALHESFAPSVAILDIGLPDLDGYEVARRIQAQGAGTHLIALSGYGEPSDLARAREAGFVCHLVKPVDMQKLVRVVRDLGGPAARGG